MKNQLSTPPVLLHAAALAAALLALTGCADMSGIAPQARLRDAATLVDPGAPAAAVAPDW